MSLSEVTLLKSTTITLMSLLQDNLEVLRGPLS